MVIVLLIKPAGLSRHRRAGAAEQLSSCRSGDRPASSMRDRRRHAPGARFRGAVPVLSALRHAGALLRDFRTLLQPAARLWRVDVVRPCRFLRQRILRDGLHDEELGLRARARHPCRNGGGNDPRRHLRLDRHQTAGHLFHDDHLRAGADRLFLLRCRRTGPKARTASSRCLPDILFGFIDLKTAYAIYYFVLALFLFGFAVVWRTVHSPFGQVLKAIRQNEPRAISLGYKVDRYKLLAFTLSAALAGLAGCAKTSVFHLATLTRRRLDDVDTGRAGDARGRAGTMLGPIVGAFVIVAMQNYLAELGSWVTIIQGRCSSPACSHSGRASSAAFSACWSVGVRTQIQGDLAGCPRPSRLMGRIRRLPTARLKPPEFHRSAA